MHRIGREQLVTMMAVALKTAPPHVKQQLRSKLPHEADEAADVLARRLARLIDNDGAVVAQRDEFPIGALLPPTTWNAGDAKPGFMALSLPADLSPGDYRVVVGVYDPATGAAVGDFFEIGTITPGAD